MRGFTLLELLLVVALIAIAASVATLALGDAEPRRMREEAERLSALFRIATSEARASGRALTWEADLSGYRFRSYDDEATERLPEELRRTRSWPFEVEHIATPRLLITREPVREPAVIEIATRGRDLHLALDALGNLSVLDCGGARCAASR
jgi:general secretion pathway protein H